MFVPTMQSIFQSVSGVVPSSFPSVTPKIAQEILNLNRGRPIAASNHSRQINVNCVSHADAGTRKK